MPRMNLHTGTACRDVSYICVLLILLVSLVAGQLQWINSPQDIQLNEDTPVGTLLFSLRLENGDGLQITSENTDVRVSETNRGARSVDADVFLNTELDYDSGLTQVKCLFKGVDNAQSETTSKVTIFITDVNDMTPIFRNLPYAAKVKEIANVNDVVYTSIVIEDKDLNDRFNYTLTSQTTDVGTFTINKITGQLILSKPLDFETVRFYQYIVEVMDLVGHTSSAYVTITVEDVQDTPPYFLDEPLRANILENALIGTYVTKVNAADGDEGVPNGVTLTITSETCRGHFSINPTSGLITLHSALDRDSGDVYNNAGVCSLTLLATEDNHQNPQALCFVQTATTTIIITIEDVNDNVPVFSSSSYTFVVDENTQQGAIINFNAPITVKDLDQGANALFEVKVTKLQDYFEVTPSQVQSTGDIFIRVKNSTILDFEKNHYLSIEIEAKDKISGSLQNSTATVYIIINNVNDNSPYFNYATFFANISEVALPGTAVTMIVATDADANDNTNNFAKITYSIENTNSDFIIDGLTGVVSMGAGYLDREIRDTYYLTVVAEDGGHMKARASLEISIYDINDNAPIFVVNTYETSLKEHETSLGRPVTVHAIDFDEENTPNSEIVYSIVSTVPQGLESNFTLDSTNGTLSVISGFDYKNIIFLPGQEGKITLIVQAKDKGIPPQSSTATIVIYLQTANNFPLCQNKDG